MEKIIIRLNPLINLDEQFNKLIKEDKEFLLYFDLTEEELTQEIGKKIIAFLNNLKIKKVRFKISRPIPKCLFGMEYNKLVREFNLPKDCYECEELFTIENDTLKSCVFLNKTGPKIWYMSDKHQIWEFLKILRLEKKPVEQCKKCLYFKRNSCDGLCFRLGNHR